MIVTTHHSVIFGVREARTLDLRITQTSYETYALANCATTPLMSAAGNNDI